jgi:putative DNA primase/helicase
LEIKDQAWVDEMARREDKEVATVVAKHVDKDIPLPLPEDLYNGNGGYSQNKFAKWVVNSDYHHFISLNDTDEVLYYDNGVYKQGGDRKICEMVVEAMDGHKITSNNANETVFLIKRRVGHDRNCIDAEEDIINLANGLYNIKNGDITQHTPNYLSARQMNVVYDKDATCPNIDKFLHEIVSEEDVVFIYELFGYMLLSNKRFGTAAFFEGRGANGKSVLMELMQHFVGRESCSEVTPNEMSGDDKFAISDLFGKALNVVDDLGNDIVDGVGAFKSVITGNIVRGQRKYGHSFSFIPNTLCIFGCNEVPTTTDTSEGYFRRMRIVNFPNVFEGEDDNKNLIDDITTRKEISGLFNVAVDAIRGVIVRGEFTGNKTVDEKRREYITKSNNILMFIDDECDITDPDAMVEKDELYNQYVLWARDRKTAVKTLGELTSAIKTLGAKVTRPRNEDGGRLQCYQGVQLKPFSIIGERCIEKNKFGQGVVIPERSSDNQQQETDKHSFGQGGHSDLDIVTRYSNSKVRMGGEGMTKTENASPHTENAPDQGMTTGMTKNTNQQQDTDSDNKLKHAVGKAVAKSDTMGAEVSMIVECYPESISTSCICGMLEERGGSLGIKERYGKWYV